MSSPNASGATKRPLEDPSSPNVKDEHDSKRPALEKDTKEEPEPTDAASPTPVKAEEVTDATVADGAAETPSVEVKEEDTVVPDAPPTAVQQQQQQQQPPPAPPVDESQWIHIRALITSAEAATVIGKGGENVTQIRRMAEAKCTVSDYQKGAGERILTVSGAVDAVAKASEE